VVSIVDAKDDGVGWVVLDPPRHRRWWSTHDHDHLTRIR